VIPSPAVSVVALPLRTRFRGITVRELALVEGPAGWGEFCPFVEYDDEEARAWWRCAREATHEGWPAPARERVEVNATVPATGPDHAHRIVVDSGARTAKVKVAEKGQTLADDLARVEAVRDALGPGGHLRVDANGGWDVEGALAAIREIARAAGGLEYVEQPVASVEDMAALRRRVDVPIAADESIRRAADPLRVARAQAADIAVLKVAPLGGVRAALRIAEAIGLPCVVSSAVESSVGLAAGLALAVALPALPHACGLGTTSLLAGDVVTEGLVPVDGSLPVPRRAPAPDPDLLARHAASAARRRWWCERLDRVQGLENAM
jgi:O-succinylbenzoate synthase